jgi:hypothetical protein
MNELEDIKLQALLQKMKLDSPEPNFTVRVMNKIFEENNALETIKAEKILGKGFWLILILFVSLMAIVYFAYSSGVQPESQLQNVLPEASKGMSNGFNSFFSRINHLPLAVGGILAAFSVLLFLDRIILSNSKLFA